ncbi:MAG: hypothetical protein KDK89_17890 [Alphaproteobacteria bacterium]|nr:hypothetical protein [Alphaproteobacteria bacterium]
MRSDPHDDGTVPVFTLSCPGYKPQRTRGKSAKKGATAAGAGNLTFAIGSEVVAEIAHADLLESWQAAEELTPAETVKMAKVAADHLGAILDSGLQSADLTEAVTDAAVVLLLALKRQGISDPKRIPPCTVMWNGQEGQERVLLGA